MAEEKENEEIRGVVIHEGEAVRDKQDLDKNKEIIEAREYVDQEVEKIIKHLQGRLPPYIDPATEYFLKSEIEKLDLSLKAQFESLRTEIQSVKTELKNELRTVNAEIQTLKMEIQSVKTEFQKELREQSNKQIAFVAVMLAVAVAIVVPTVAGIVSFIAFPPASGTGAIWFLTELIASFPP